MKKMLTVTLLLIMIMTLGACGSDKPKRRSTSSTQKPVTPTENTLSTTDTKPNDTESSDSEHPYETFDELPGNVGVNLSTVKYIIGAPTRRFGAAGSGYISNMDDYFVIYGEYVDISSERRGVQLENIKKASDVFEEMKPQICFSSRDGYPYLKDIEMTITKSEDITVNNWDMCRYEGTLELISEYPLDFYSSKYVGYGMIKDGYPVFFIVVDNTIDQNAEGLGDLADKIAKTFREYEN